MLRLGVKNKNEIKKHPFFQGINWEKIQKKEYDTPINIEYDIQKLDLEVPFDLS